MSVRFALALAASALLAVLAETLYGVTRVGTEVVIEGWLRVRAPMTRGPVRGAFDA